MQNQMAAVATVQTPTSLDGPYESNYAQLSSYHCVSGVGKAVTFNCNLKDFCPAVTSNIGPFL